MTTETQTQTGPQLRGLWTSASNSAADRACPGRHLAQRALPDDKSEASQAGDRIHAALAKQDPAGLDLEETEMYDRCKRVEEALVIAYFGADVAQMKMFPSREKRQWIEWMNEGGLRHSGQADAIYRRKDKALVIDYKTGRNETAGSPHNLQLRDLAVLNWVNMPLLTEIGVAIIQPWITEKPDICAYKLPDIKKGITELLARVKASNDSASQRVAGDVQCRFCRAKPNCAEYQAWAGTLVPMVDRTIFEVPVAEWTPEQRASFLNNLGPAEKILAECKEAMKAGLKEDPAFVPGWGLKDGQKRDTIVNAQAVFSSFSETGGTLEQFMECITVGKTKLKEALSAVTKKKGKALDAALTEVIGGNVESKTTEPTLTKLKEEA
jgi:hypothetical protein